MKRRLLLWMSIAMALALPIRAQDKSANPEPPGKNAFLKVDVALNEFDGDKKVGSLPYTIFLNATGDPSYLRMGLRVPDTSKGQTQYQSVGTNIDCNARPLDGGSFALTLTVSRSSLYLPAAGKSASAAQDDPQINGSAQIMRDFSSRFSLALRDGQSSESTVATDPVSGRVIRIVVSLTVMK